MVYPFRSSVEVPLLRKPILPGKWFFSGRYTLSSSLKVADILMIHRFIKRLDNVAVLRCFVTDGDADHGFFLCGLRRRGQQGQSERQREQNDPWLVSDSLFSCDAPAGMRFLGGVCVLLSCFCSIFYIDRRQLVNRPKVGEREKKGKKIQAAGGCLYFYLII